MLLSAREQEGLTPMFCRKQQGCLIKEMGELLTDSSPQSAYIQEQFCSLRTACHGRSYVFKS